MATPISHSKEFSKFVGEMAESLSFNKSIGQIYGLLYISSKPLSLEDIAKTLGMSKGNASINLRILDQWGAVHSKSIYGSRRDFYQANHNLKEVALRRLKEGLGRRLDHTERALEQLVKNMENQPKDSANPFMKQKIKELQAMASRARKTFDLAPKLLRFLG